MPTAQLRVGGILHVDDPADDEDAQPCQQKVLHFNSWKATLWRLVENGRMQEEKKSN